MLLRYKRQMHLKALRKKSTVSYTKLLALKKGKVYRRMKKAYWQWKVLEHFQQGRFDLKMAYIEERKFHRA